jgi:hypothetical protein
MKKMLLKKQKVFFSARSAQVSSKASSVVKKYVSSTSFTKSQVMAYDLDCDAAAAADDDDDCLQYYTSGIEGDAIRARLTAKYKLLHNDRPVVKDKLLKRESAGAVFKRIEEGYQWHSTLHRVESRADQASSSRASADESQSSSLPAIKIDAGFFKSYAQRIKKQREILSSEQSCGAPTKSLVHITVRPDCTVDHHIRSLHRADRFKWDDLVDVSLLHVKDTMSVKQNARKLSAKFESEY